MDSNPNPFALVKASDYTDAQINSLWVELGHEVIERIIEPNLKMSKYILGGKGTGKTHLLRYHSYQVARLRYQDLSGHDFLQKQNSLSVFLRANALDAAKFEIASLDSNTQSVLFGIYLELRLAECIMDSLLDFKNTSPGLSLNELKFITSLKKTISNTTMNECKTLEDFKQWLVYERRTIDDAINKAAFTGTFDFCKSFSFGDLSIPIKTAIQQLYPLFQDIPLLYLIDEIENFSIQQQEVVNSLIRYGEGLVSFRITGRLYARKTSKTINNGEENHEGAEYKTTILDEILIAYPKYSSFAKKFFLKRISIYMNARKTMPSTTEKNDPNSYFEELKTENYYETAITRLGLEKTKIPYYSNFLSRLNSLPTSDISEEFIQNIFNLLIADLPILLGKLNILLFYKDYSKKKDYLDKATQIREDCISYINNGNIKNNSYSNAYGHYSNDLFVQLCRESPKNIRIPYAGFKSFVNMSSNNPRNLLILLGRAYEIATFKQINFIDDEPLSIAIQTDAAIETSRFMFERDTNYGSHSEEARQSTERLALVLLAARFSLTLPEVSPLAVSFADSELSKKAKENLDNALNYSLIFEVHNGRPDRNHQRLNRKIHLNPILSPRWGLPISYRGDIPLTGEIANAIFDPDQQERFRLILNYLEEKWNNPFDKHTKNLTLQRSLF